MPIDSLTVGPPAVGSPGSAKASKAGAPPGFSAALDTAAKTWTALAEGQTPSKRPGTDRPAAPSVDAERSAAAAPETPAQPDEPATTEQPGKADLPVKADSPADVTPQADEPTEVVATGETPVLPVPAAPAGDPTAAVLAAAIAAAQAALDGAPTPQAPAAAESTAPLASAQAVAVAQAATDVLATATAVAAGAPVDPAAPGVAELLASVESGETVLGDLPESVQALVAKAGEQLAAQAATTATTSKTATAAPSADAAAPASASAAAMPAPAVAQTDATQAQAQPADAASTQANAAATAAGSAATAAAPGQGDAVETAPSALSPLAAAIQAAAQAQTDAGSSDGQRGEGQQPAPQTPAAVSTVPGAAPAEATELPSPVQAAGSSPITVAPTSAPAVSTAAAPAIPTVQAPTAGAQSAAIEALVHLSRTRGHSSARIALAPEQLGGIQVTLIFGQDGVTARLIAERPEAAAALHRAGQDLKDSLQQQGVDLARLETGFAGDSGQGRGDRQAAGDAMGGRFGSSPGRHGAGDATDGTTQTLHLALDEQPAPEPLVPGRLVDLRA